MLAPPQRVSTPSYRESWIRPCYVVIANIQVELFFM